VATSLSTRSREDEYGNRGEREGGEVQGEGLNDEDNDEEGYREMVVSVDNDDNSIANSRRHRGARLSQSCSSSVRT
jgi:hypothetical protein